MMTQTGDLGLYIKMFTTLHNIWSKTVS